MIIIMFILIFILIRLLTRFAEDGRKYEGHSHTMIIIMFILIHLTGFAWDDEHSYNITIDHTQSISIYQSIFKLPVKDDPQNGDKRQGNREAVDSKNNGCKS